MIIKSIFLENFRNHQKKEFKFLPDLILVVGPNTSGKTNLIEAIYLLAVGKSFRTGKDIEAITWDKELARIKGVVQTDEDRIELEVILTKGEVVGIKTPYKKYLINGVGKRAIGFVGSLKVVLFWPEDLQLVTDSPSLRRKYLDYVLVQTDKEYRRTLLSFDRGIRQRNRLLEAIRDQGASRQQLIFWDQLLIKAGAYITKKREEYIDFINKIENPNNKISAPPVGRQILNYKLEYDKSIISRQRLDQYSEEEVASGVTLVGPHRDEIKFKIQNPKFKNKENNYRDLASFGSRGEQRLAILWLKLGELSYIKDVTHERPVLLLDDILSELDHEHREIVFDIIKEQQTIMTTSDRHFIPDKFLQKSDTINLE